MRTIILSSFLSLLFTIYSHGQNYEVLEAKRSFKQGGEKIRKGDLVSKNEIVLIREKGYLTLDIETPIDLKLAPGKHNIDSLSTRLAISYKKHEGLENILKKKGILECKFKYEVWIVPGTTRHYEADRIVVSEEHISVSKNSSESMTINWKNPDKKYNGNYTVIIKDAFSKLFIDVLETDKPSLSFFPGKYGHQYMLYHVVAEDCRASRTYRIEVKP